VQVKWGCECVEECGVYVEIECCIGVLCPGEMNPLWS
jgi:hypothetical protein